MSGTKEKSLKSNWACIDCDIKNLPENDLWYTREELLDHLNEVHNGSSLCIGCSEFIDKHESDKGHGWCELCVSLCYDCKGRCA